MCNFTRWLPFDPGVVIHLAAMAFWDPYDKKSDEGDISQELFTYSYYGAYFPQYYEAYFPHYEAYFPHYEAYF